MHAVRRRATQDTEHIRFGFLYAQGQIQSQRIAGTTAVAVGRDDRHRTQVLQGLGQGTYAIGPVAIIIADENFHAGQYSGWGAASGDLSEAQV